MRGITKEQYDSASQAIERAAQRAHEAARLAGSYVSAFSGVPNMGFIPSSIVGEMEMEISIVRAYNGQGEGQNHES